MYKIFLVVMAISVIGFCKVTKISNNQLIATFNQNGLVSLSDADKVNSIDFEQLSFDLKIDYKNVADLKCLAFTNIQNKVIYHYKNSDFKVKVVYTLLPNCNFISQQMFLLSDKTNQYIVNKITPMQAKLKPGKFKQTSKLTLSRGANAEILRFGKEKDEFGIFFLIQNPFMKWENNDFKINIYYKSDMIWNNKQGPYPSDLFCIGLYALSGVKYPCDLVQEWVMSTPQINERYIDLAEMQALANCVRQGLLFKNDKTLKVHIGWCENDYQIDVATEAGQIEYKRILKMAHELGCDDVLYTPRNTLVSSPSENGDAWGWEEVLWLNLGQKIRKDEWDMTQELPPNVKMLQDYATKNKIKLMAYAYPAMKWLQNPKWTAWYGEKGGSYNCADSGIRSFQDFMIEKLVTFAKKYKISGYSFDHWWMAYDPKDGSTSRYSQWYGCRRVLESLRQAVPDIIIDGRQQYHWFGPWTWLAGSYPHPMMSDEQPGSFKAYPDLHADRVYGNRTRFINYMLRITQHVPIEIVPGFMTHQTQRSDATGKQRKTTFHAKDWDYLAWKYSVISSIATAPLNNVINYIPARDLEEFNAISAADKKWFRDMLDWTDINREVLQNLIPIIGQPKIGYVDGTAAIKEGKGFIFLFNPNYRKMNAEFKLDKSIGLDCQGDFLIKEIYPNKNRLIGKKEAGVWSFNDDFTMKMSGGTAMILEIEPLKSLKKPLIFDLTGKVKVSGAKVEVSNCSGLVGTKQSFIIKLKSDSKIEALTVNGQKVDFSQKGSVLSAKIKFWGQALGHSQALVKYDSQNTGGKVSAKLRIPTRIIKQLAARKKEWPIKYTQDDLIATWLGPERLLLAINIAEPDQDMIIKLAVNGKDVPVKKSYNTIYGGGGNKTFMGFYADLSDLQAKKKYKLELSLPKLKAGQFQGMFLDNIEDEFTQKIRPIK